MLLAKRLLPYFISLVLWGLIGIAIYGCSKDKRTADSAGKISKEIQILGTAA